VIFFSTMLLPMMPSSLLSEKLRANSNI